MNLLKVLFFFSLSFLLGGGDIPLNIDENNTPLEESNSKYYFVVDIPWLGSTSFVEIDGLSLDQEPPEQRNPNSPKGFSSDKLPGLADYSRITLRGGIIPYNKLFEDWYQSVKMNVIERGLLEIRLIDEYGEELMKWKLFNAWPSRVSLEYDPESNKVWLYEIDIVYEGLF